MNIHLSEEEQVEAVKRWWKENGRSAVAGVVIGVGAIFGWQLWGQHQTSQAEQASFKFEQLDQTVSAGRLDSAVKQAEALIGESPGSVYAQFAALSLAKVKLQQGDGAAAKSQLQWVIEWSSDDSIKQIARLRLARLHLDQGSVEAALSIVEQAPMDRFAGDFAELRGDIARLQGDNVAARQAYERALAQSVSNAAVVQMKFSELAVDL